MSLKAWELLSKPEKWTTGDYAKDAHGSYVGTSDPQAVCFCALGAILRCYKDDDTKRREVSNQLGEHLYKQGFVSIAAWNDEVGYETVHSTLKELDI